MSPLSHRIARTVETVIEGLPERELVARATRISEAYRANRHSSDVIKTPMDAAVYALMRVPATAAAVDAVLEMLVARAPDFMPASVLDAGCGPGTAGLVASAFWPEAAFALHDAHPALLALAKKLMNAEAPDVAARFTSTDLIRPVPEPAAADLVLASYVLTEFDDETYPRVAERLWAATKGVLVIVEPGRPRDDARLKTFRTWAIAAGAEIVAPCPHAFGCPLQDPDWCHFSVRLSRTRLHRQMKGGALGYEDEKYACLVLARPGIALEAPQSRVLALPNVAKHETRLKLCRPDGQAGWQAFSKRDPQFGQIRRTKWGGSIVSNGKPLWDDRG